MDTAAPPRLSRRTGSVNRGRTVRSVLRAAPRALGVALPAALVLVLAFTAGGFFPLTPALLALGLGLALVVRITVAEQPFEGLAPSVGVAVAALALVGCWTLASIGWGAVTARALIEFDRVLLYALAILLMGSVLWRPRERRRMVWLAVGAMGVVCVFALVSRLIPAAWPVGAEFATGPLAYPLGYTNALGIFAGLGLVLSLHVTSDHLGARPARIVFAGLLPVFAATLLLTFSRGAILATALGLALYAVLGRPRAFLGGALAAGPPTAYVLAAAYRAELVADATPVDAAALAQAGEVAWSVGLAAVGAMALRALLLPLDSFLTGVRVSRGQRRIATGLAGAAVVAAAVAVAVTVDLPTAAAEQYERLAVEEESAVTETRERLTASGTSGRFEEWGVAWRQFREAPLIGAGAASYQTTWARERPVERDLRDAHSLYFEAASELGAVGLGLMVVFVGAILLGLLGRARGPGRALPAGLAAAWAAWAAHAGIDWDWEMPAIGLPLLCLGAAVLSSPAPIARPDGGPRAAAGWIGARTARVAGGLGLLVVLSTPALVAVSQVRLEDALAAWNRGDCVVAIDRSLGALEAVGSRTEPRELIGYCDARFGLHPLSEQSMRSAIARDPNGWDLWYGLALVRGVARLDPRPALERARQLNPRESLVLQTARELRSDDPDVWQRESLSADLPVPAASRPAPQGGAAAGAGSAPAADRPRR